MSGSWRRRLPSFGALEAGEPTLVAVGAAKTLPSP